MRTVASAWEDFKSKAFGNQEIHPIQEQEMRRAFYAGAYYMLNAFARIGEDDSISEDAGAAILDGYEQELRQFAKDVKEGRA